MDLRAGVVVIVALLASCRPPLEAAPGESTAGAEPAERCPAIKPERGTAAFARAESFLQLIRREEHPPQATWDAGMNDLREAAEHGHLEGQYRYGVTLFGAIFTDHAPEPKDKDDYVSALTYLRVSALRGYPDAKRSFPDLAVPRLPARLDPPLDQVPREWIVEGLRGAERFLRCAPERAKDPFQSANARGRLLEKTDSGWLNPYDLEGPMLRVTFRSDGEPKIDPAISTRLLGALPGIFDCYSAWIAKDPEATAELKLSVSNAKERAIDVSGVDDEKFKKCVSHTTGNVLARELGDQAGQGTLRIALYPRAASAPVIHEPADGVKAENWKEDGSCWTDLIECAPKKLCRAPEPVRVRCPK